MMGVVFLGVVMLAASVFCTQIDTLKAQLAAWVGIPFFGCCLLFAMWQVGRMDAVLVIGADGIDYRRMGTGVIPWNEVIDVSVGKVRNERFLCVQLRDEGPYLRKLILPRRMWAWANRVMGFPLLSISFRGLTCDIEKALRAIDRHRSPI